MDFTVIIPSKDRPANLARCLEQLQQIDYPAGRWELIVVDDGGQNTLDERAEAQLANLPARVLREAARGPASARNLAARQARGRFLAFTDDDCLPEPDWLNAFRAGFEHQEISALGGPTLNPFREQYASRAAQYLMEYLYSYLRMPNDDVYLLIANNAAYRRDVFLQLGGFDESFPYAAAEDRELSHRMVVHGYRQAFCPAARVWHHHPLTTAGYLRQQLRYGRGNAHFRQALTAKNFPLRIGQRRRPQFHIELARRLWRDRMPWQIWWAVFLGQGAHLYGTLRETLSQATLRPRVR